METEVQRQDCEITGTTEDCSETPEILEDITIEEMAVDGICGIY